jgi:hypothetical protein
MPAPRPLQDYHAPPPPPEQLVLVHELDAGGEHDGNAGGVATIDGHPAATGVAG